MNEETLFTSAALLDFLNQVDELAEYPITVDENSGAINVKIGESSYTIAKSDAQEVEVPDEVVEEVSDITEATFEEIDNTEYEQIADIPEDAPIEAGIISEILKTLAVGGMVRLTGKMLGKDIKSSEDITASTRWYKDVGCGLGELNAVYSEDELYRIFVNNKEFDPVMQDYSNFEDWLDTCVDNGYFVIVEH